MQTGTVSCLPSHALNVCRILQTPSTPLLLLLLRTFAILNPLILIAYGTRTPVRAPNSL